MKTKQANKTSGSSKKLSKEQKQAKAVSKSSEVGKSKLTKDKSFINDIFKKAQKAKVKNEMIEKEKLTEMAKQEIESKKHKKKMMKEANKMAKSITSSGKRTEGGLKVFTMDELNIGKGGDTDLCPFD